jgi:hypothetical protein
VASEQRDKLERQADCAAARLGLDLARSLADIHPLRAEPRCLLTGAVAAMRVPGPQPRAADAQHAVVQVHVLPPQAQRLALPQSQRQGESPPGAIAPLAGHPQQTLDLLDAVRFDFLLVQFRGFGEEYRVAAQVRPPNGLVERSASTTIRAAPPAVWSYAIPVTIAAPSSRPLSSKTTEHCA